MASGAGHVATWAEVDAFIQAVSGLCTVVVDDSIAAATVPGTANTECFGRVVLTSPAIVPGALLSLDDTARLRNIGTIQGGLSIRGAPSAVMPLEFNWAGRGLVMKEGASIGLTAGAAVSMCSVLVAGISIEMNDGAFLDNAAAPTVSVVDVAAGQNLVFATDGSLLGLEVFGTWFSGDVTTTLDLFRDPTITLDQQTLFLGAITEHRVENADALKPSFGGTGSRPTAAFGSAPENGQMYFDTDLAAGSGLPIWWNGTTWVQATPPALVDGVPVAQLGSSIEDQVYANTALAAPATVNSSYVAPLGHAAGIDGTLVVTNRAAATVTKLQVVGSLRRYGAFPGVYAVAGFLVTGAHGDASLATCAVTAAVVGGVLQFTFTPPAGYGGNLEWFADLTMTEN